MPILKVWYKSFVLISKLFCKKLNIGIFFQDVVSISTENSPGITRGTLSTKPPPVMWAMLLILIPALVIRVIKEL